MTGSEEAFRDLIRESFNRLMPFNAKWVPGGIGKIQQREVGFAESLLLMKEKQSNQLLRINVAWNANNCDGHPNAECIHSAGVLWQGAVEA